MTEITRKSILAEAEKCVCTDREQQYGSPENNLELISAFWTNYLESKRLKEGPRFELHAHDVAIMMALLKIGRIATGVFKEDSYADLAGYAACAGEIAHQDHHCAT
jgi:hypothetical protein